MSIIARQIDAVIRAELAPTLKALGFKKKGRNFRRRVQDAKQIVNIQASQWNTGSEGLFTVNLGLYFPATATLVPRYQEIEEPTQTDCSLRKRIGQLMPPPQDTWWSVDSNTDIAKLSRSLTENVVQYGIPWLDRFSELAAAAQADNFQFGRIGLAALLLANGERDACLRLMETSIVETDQLDDGWAAFATAAGLETEYRHARAKRSPVG